MKILSNKKFNELIEELEELKKLCVETKLDLQVAKEDNNTYYEQVEYLRTELRNEINKNNENILKIQSLNRETKKLKTLLSKNNIEYKKKGTKKNGK